ncbi:MAG: hypothetical protein GY793_06695 [Proteobacteria bacterium]|nr:hypothetical protein [Pseudomonadota bacterium]
MKKFIFFLTIFISFSIVSAFAAGTFSVVHKTNREEINYHLPITGDFQVAFLNALKTGKVVKIAHKVKIRPVSQWIGWLAEKKYVKYYKYNLINDQYYVGVSENRLKQVPSIKDVFKDVTSLNDAPFLPLNILQRGNAYEIDFTIIINPADDNMGLLLFKGDRLKERLHGAVHYINK